MTDLLTRLYLTGIDRVTWGHSDRGDVPGWVLVTLMSALLVVALLAAAQDRLVALFERAMAEVG